jgi:hypothetical protein
MYYKSYTKVEECAHNSSTLISPLSTLPTKFVTKSFLGDLLSRRLEKDGLAFSLNAWIQAARLPSDFFPRELNMLFLSNID